MSKFTPAWPAAACVLAAVVAWLLLRAPDPAAAPAQARLTIAVPVQLSAGSLYVARERKLFGQQRLEVVFQSHQLGKTALQSVIDGKADLALVADTPFMLAILRESQIATVSTVFESRKVMAVLARAERGIAKPEDLAGKNIGTVAGTNAQFFLDTLLLAHGLSRDSASVTNLEPSELGNALRAGKFDAITVWMPELAALQREFGARAVTLYAEDLFVYRFLVAGRKDYIDAHAGDVRKLLAALDESNRYIRENPHAARAIMGKAIGLEPSLLAHDFNTTDFTLSLDQSLMIALDEQTRWALGRGLVVDAKAPNYLDFVRPHALESVQPTAVRLIR
jgi:ABC-type nitrate/sulfonate/bicarbonate transport system substrate-binding protein